MKITDAQLRSVTPDQLKSLYGVHGVAARPTGAFDSAVTAPNSGIPSIFSTWTDPNIKRAIITPIKSEEVYGQAQKGDWLTDTAQFPFVELSGQTASYDDYSQNGDSDTNANWVQRQSFHFQTWTKWGEREAERMGAARLDWVSQKNEASISVLNKASNRINLFGVEGLQLRGALNDPDLPAAIQPTPKVASSGTATGGTDWMSTTDPVQVYNDILKAFQQLSVQMGGNVTLESPLTLVIPTERQQCLLYTNQFRVSLRELLQQNLPNLTIETLPEAGSTLSGGQNKITQMQLFLREVDGQETVTTAFTEKLRAHAVERYSSYIRQKKSQGTWGAIWFYPVACVTMVGI
ncbi:DUF2184 domain-containing protein [Parasaccharibacter sp. TMW 2.1884]|uniref:DUF2184 domain-containing protein n=1 Tax=Parasaccharibacter sp. TMW 2.1884 TaxID=2267834 RepID=UPI002012C4BA|nr:DUF2184 domain-containing protein [Parasaccharibacter sp. TMW 2.1884]MCL1512464.1 DUF2184 domain-containing protein [Parasaccharibacter sp. TMW 2.1884]